MDALGAAADNPSMQERGRSGFVAEQLVADPALSDESVVERVRAGETALFEVLIRRLNQRLYRVIRAILRDDAEVEDVMQETYIAAYSCLHQFAGRARPSTWVTRIAIHNAYARLHRRRARERLTSRAREPELPSLARDPEHLTSTKEEVLRLQCAIDALPEIYRIVFVTREVEQLDTAETAALLELSEEAVRVRLHRAKAMLRVALESSAAEQPVFTFLRPRCDRVVLAVQARIGWQPSSATALSARA